MGTVGRPAAAAWALLCLRHGLADAQPQSATGDATQPDAAGPEAASTPTTGPVQDARGSVPIRVAYTAHDGCPDSNAFVARVLERTALARVAEPGEIARTLVVGIRRDGGASTGQISLADRSGVTSTREVAGASCDQVVTALALVASVSIAEGAAATESRGPSPAPTQPTPEPTPTSATSARPTSPEPGQGGDRAARPEPTPDREATAQAVTVAVGAGGEITSAYDELLLAPRVFGELGFGLEPLSDAAVRLSLLYAANGVDDDAGSADFSWWMARLGLCPLGLGEAIKLRPCVGLEGGVMHSESTYPASDPPETRFWGAGLAFLRLQVRVWETVWLEADGGATVPFSRYRFLVDEGNTNRAVREVPRVGGFGAIGAGIGLL